MKKRKVSIVDTWMAKSPQKEGSIMVVNRIQLWNELSNGKF